MLQQQKAAVMSSSEIASAKVVVVGSGFAGVATASTLVKAGFKNILILEAKDRVGGRVNTAKPFTDNNLEVGANWIHGQKGNPVFELAKKNNLLSEGPSASSDASDDYFFREDGKEVPDKLVEKVRSLYSKLTDKADDDELDSRYETMTMGDYLDAAFEKSRLSDTEDGSKVFEWCKRNDCTDEACTSLYEVSASQMSDYTEPEGEFFNTLGPGGYQAVLDVVLKDLPPGTIKLNAAVKSIQWDLIKTDDDEEDGYPVRITCEDGQSFEADHVIVTVSLGVLKNQAATMFNPPLPQAKLNAIKNLGFGLVDKIFLYFDQKFWPKDCSGIQLVWEEGPEDKEVYEALAKGDAWKKTWYKKITGFDEVARHPTALCGWITGREAIHMETLEDSEIADVCVGLLKSFTGWSVPKVSEMLISRWGRDPQVQGSYSYIPHEVNGVKEQKALAAPLPLKNSGRKLQVLFAGEATNEKFYTTTHGAYLTGVREAKRLINYYID